MRRACPTQPYVETAEGWLYLACVMDLASRRIVGWSMSDRVQTDLVNQGLKAAYGLRKPAAGPIMHTDRGSQYASANHRKRIGDYEMVQSMSRRANCWDNAAIESFFKTLKVERIHRIRYQSRAQAKLDIVNRIEGFYNRQRIHSSELPMRYCLSPEPQTTEILTRSGPAATPIASTVAATTVVAGSQRRFVDMHHDPEIRCAGHRPHPQPVPVRRDLRRSTNPMSDQRRDARRSIVAPTTG
jgi:hypothetical protein